MNGEDGDDDDVRVVNPLNEAITFDSIRSRLTVFYQTNEGEAKRTCRGLRVRQYDASYKALDPKVYQKTMDAKTKKAKKMWNMLDKSERKRYAV